MKPFCREGLLGLLIWGGLVSPCLALEETNAVPFNPSFETNLWAIATRSQWVTHKTLHVDTQAVNASDANDGSEDHPLKTISRAVVLSSPGTRILVYPGTYRESVTIGAARSGTELAPLVIEAKEPGTAVLSGSEVYTQWTHYAGNTWYTTWTKNWGVYPNPVAPWPQIGELGRRREMVFVNGVFYWQVLTPEEMTSETFYVDDANQRIYIHMRDSSSPADHLVEISERQNGFRLSTTALGIGRYVVLRGLVFQHNHLNSFKGHHTLVEDCKSVWNNGSNIIGGTDYVVRRMVALHCGQLGLHVQADSLDQDGLIESCMTSYGNWRYGTMGGLYGFAQAGIKVHILQNLIIRGHTSQFNETVGIWTDNRCNNVLIEDSLVTHNRLHGLWIEINNGETVVRNNTVANNLGSGIQISNTAYLRIYGNVISSNAVQIGHWHTEEERVGFRTVGLRIFNNIIQGPNPVQLPNYASLNNTIAAGLNRYSPTLWNANGKDTTSTVVNPPFRNPALLDFTVNAGSALLSDTNWAFVTASLTPQSQVQLSANRAADVHYTPDHRMPSRATTVYSVPVPGFQMDGQLQASASRGTAVTNQTVFGPVTRLAYASGRTNLLANPGFELGGTLGWTGFGATVEASALQARSGNFSGRVRRNQIWGGARQSLAGLMTTGQTYRISSWLRLENTNTAVIKATLVVNNGQNHYATVGSATISNTGWTEIAGTYTMNIPGTIQSAHIYWEGPPAEVTYYIDDVSMVNMTNGELPTFMTIQNPTPFAWLDSFYPGTNSYENAAAQDSDGDGFAAWQEYLAGTDPTDPDSRFNIVETRDENGMVHITWKGGRTSPELPPFSLQRSTNLLQEGGGFVHMDHIVRSPTGTNLWTGAVESGPAYYRVVATNGID